jgi:shikimate dehydrogenase
MSPNTEDMVAFPTSNLGTGHLVVDLVYSPPQTQLLGKAQARGAVVLNGQDMLRLQADKAWEIWAEAGV